MNVKRLIMFVVMTVLASAFASAYDIGTCQELWDSRLLDTSGYFRLTADIDCSGFPFNSTISMYNTFNGTFDGNYHVIKDFRLNVTVSPIEFGFIGNALDGTTIKNVVFEGFSLDAGTSGLGQECGLIGDASNGAIINISGVGIRDGYIRCRTADAFFLGLRDSNQQIHITDSYIINSTQSIITGYNEKGVFVGLRNGINTNISMTNIISDVYHDFIGSSKYAITQDGIGIIADDVIWVNKSSLQAFDINPVEAYEIEESKLYDPVNIAWENFSIDIWKFSYYNKPIFQWETEKIQNFSGIYTYTSNASCDGNNYWFSRYSEWGGGNEIQCIDTEGDIYLYPEYVDYLNYTFCFNTSSAEFYIPSALNAIVDVSTSSLSEKVYPWGQVWTNEPIRDLSGYTDVTLLIIKDNGVYYRYDMNLISGGGHYNISADYLRRCDGSMLNYETVRCSAPYSKFFDDTPFDDQCHLWFNETVEMTSSKNSSNIVYLTDGNTLDCNGHTWGLDSTYIYDYYQNLSTFTIKDCYLDNINPSQYSGFQLNSFAKYEPFDILIDNVNINQPNSYNSIIYQNSYSEGNLTIRDSSTIDFLIDGRLQNMYIINNTDSYGEQKRFLVQTQSGIDGYLLMTENKFDSPSSSVFSGDGFDYVDLYLNDGSSSLYDGFGQLGRSIVNMTYNNFKTYDDTYSVWEGFYDSYIAYNNFSHGANIYWGDDDADPEIYNATSFNEEGSFQWRYTNNSIFEYNEFKNVSGSFQFRYYSNYNHIRYNNFLEAGVLYLRYTSQYNKIYGNTMHCDDVHYNYGCYGIYMRDNARHNEIYDNNITGNQGRGLYDRNSGENIWHDNYVNLTVPEYLVSDMNDLWYGGYRAIDIRDGASGSIFYGNTISMNLNATVVVTKDGSVFNSNDFYLKPVVNLASNNFSCNTYNEGSYLYGADDTCYNNTALICTGITNTSVLVNTSYSWDVRCSDIDSIKNFSIQCTPFSYTTSVYALTYNYSNSSIITEDTFCQYHICDDNLYLPQCSSFSQVIVANPPFPDSGALQVGQCPDDLTGNVTLFGMIFIGLILIAIGALAPSAFFGIFGCLVLLFGATYLSGCSGAIGYIVGAMSIVGVIWFAVRKT